MSVQSEIDRINSNVQSALNSVADTGVSVPEGANSDNLPAAVSALANEKQDKLTGAQGQVVGFDENGNAVAQNAPSGGGMTEEAADGKYLKLAGGDMSGKLTAPKIETGSGNTSYFQSRKFRGEGDAATYYHAIDFGYKNHDQVDFHEYGGIWNFFKNTSGKANEGSLCGKITTNGWEGRAKLKSGSTMVTSQLTENSDAIATTAFVHGLVDGVKPKKVSVTLTASSWNSSSKTQTVSVAGVTATANGSLRIAQSATDEQFAAWGASQPRVTAQAAGTLTVKVAGTVPTIDIPVEVLIV